MIVYLDMRAASASRPETSLAVKRWRAIYAKLGLVYQLLDVVFHSVRCVVMEVIVLMTTLSNIRNKLSFKGGQPLEL